MKKISSLIILIVFFTTSSFANDYYQEPPGRRLAALKIAFITRQLKLTTEEAEKFWPVYNNYTGELRKARMEQKKEEDILLQEEEMLNVRKKYRPEFKKILGTDARANQSLTMERDFNNLLRKELQKRRERGPKQKKDTLY